MIIISWIKQHQSNYALQPLSAFQSTSLSFSSSQIKELLNMTKKDKGYLTSSPRGHAKRMSLYSIKKMGFYTFFSWAYVIDKIYCGSDDNME